MIEIADLRIAFAGQDVVKGVTFQVAKAARGNRPFCARWPD